MELNLSAMKRMASNQDAPLVAFLKNLPLFEGVNSSIIETLASECPIENYVSGATILLEGDASNGQAYVIISGTVDIFIGSEKISSLGQGALFGEYALICSENRSATVRSTSELQCLILKEPNIFQITDETHRFNDVLTQRINENIEANRGVFKI